MHLERVFDGVRELIGTSESNEVHRDHPMSLGEYRNHLSIEIRPRRLTVQTQNCFALAFIDVVDSRAVDLNVVRLEGKAGQVGEPFVGRAK